MLMFPQCVWFLRTMQFGGYGFSKCEQDPSVFKFNVTCGTLSENDPSLCSLHS